MAIRVRCVSILCIGSLMVPMAQANGVKVSLDKQSMKAGTSMISGAIDQTLMGIVNQVMYEKTPAQVIDELMYTYGDQSSNPLAGIAQLLSQQSIYLGMAITAAQCIVNVLPPTSPHIVAAKLVINELSTCNTCVQTILSAMPQNGQTTAAASVPSATGATPAVNAAPAAAPVSTNALESAVMTLVDAAASAVQTISSSAGSSSSSSSSSTAGSASSSSAHQHGSHTSHK